MNYNTYLGNGNYVDSLGLEWDTRTSPWQQVQPNPFGIQPNTQPNTLKKETMKGHVFQYVIIQDGKEDEPSKLLAGPTAVVATDSNNARIKALRDKALDDVEDLDNIRVQVSIFNGAN